MGCLKIRPDCGRPDGKKRQRPAPLFGAGILFARLSRMTALERLKTCPFMLCGLQIVRRLKPVPFPSQTAYRSTRLKRLSADLQPAY